MERTGILYEHIPYWQQLPYSSVIAAASARELHLDYPDSVASLDSSNYLNDCLNVGYDYEVRLEKKEIEKLD